MPIHKYTDGDLVERVETHCPGMEWGIRQQMEANADTDLECVLIDPDAWETRGDTDVIFYAYSEKYIYFLEKTFYMDGDPCWQVVSIPRHPNPDNPILYFGGTA